MSAVGKWVLAWLVIATAFAWFQVFQIDRQNKLVFWPDVEDGMLIQTDQGRQILVNGGRGQKILEDLGRVMPWGNKTLDLVVLTSSQESYLEGLMNVLQNYKVDKVLWTGAIQETPIFQAWQKILEKKKVKVVIAQAGQTLSLGKFTLDVLWPAKNLNRCLINPEEGNMIWKLQKGDRKFLFLGNASTLSLTQMKDEDLSADIVEVNGMQKDLPLLFWSRINPSVVVASGEFPNNSLPSRTILRQTDRDGQIIINF